MSSEKTVLMKRKGAQYIIHGLFVDDMMHIYSCGLESPLLLRLRETHECACVERTRGEDGKRRTLDRQNIHSDRQVPRG